jgi:hypothetical protein
MDCNENEQLDPTRVTSRPELISFIQRLRASMHDNPEMFTNRTLDSYLEAMTGFLMDRDGYRKNGGEAFEDEDRPTWGDMAVSLEAAAIYE